MANPPLALHQFQRGDAAAAMGIANLIGGQAWVGGAGASAVLCLPYRPAAARTATARKKSACCAALRCTQTRPRACLTDRVAAHLPSALAAAVAVGQGAGQPQKPDVVATYGGEALLAAAVAQLAAARRQPDYVLWRATLALCVKLHPLRGTGGQRLP